ncbi:MAG: Stk1 family PASTA domain-containing Ser/Thr kinase [Erysipelothrix sp.]|nr:Stk1 family PASTA domain-containing Ser/Thr kinase [Erysipelothrix sp.]
MDNLQLKRYTILEKIGKGGMADVYLAYDNVLKRECAIKILLSELSNDAVAKLRFRREADAAANLQHPNITTIYDVGEAANRPFIVMEYVHGQTLKELIVQRGFIEKKEAVFLMIQILEGIDCAHKAGVIHRDVKPQNIIVKADGTAKVADFGIASIQGSIQLTQHDSVMGSVHYLAPECSKGHQASIQSDIYSLGIVFFEMLTGEVPYKGDAAVQVALKHMNEKMRGVREYNNSIEQSIENIIIKATAKNREQRYKTIQEMLKDLRVALEPEHLNDKKLILEHTPLSSELSQETKVFADKELIEPETVDSKLSLKNKILIGVIATSLIAILLLLISSLIPSANNKKSFNLSNYSGQSISEVTSKLKQLGLTVNPTYLYEVHETIEKDNVINTIPSANELVKEGDIIQLIVSEGTYYVIEDYSEKSLEEVREMLRTQLNINLIVEYESSKEVDEGIVLRQENLSPNEKISPNKRYDLKLIVSRPVTFQIPVQLIGMNYLEAETLLKEKGATVLFNAIDSSTLSDEVWEKTEFEVITRVTPTVGSSYTQTSGAIIELTYFTKTERTIVKVDKVKLETLLNDAQLIDLSDKTAESVHILNLAKQNSLLVMNNPDAKQKQVDDAYDNLLNAINGLQQIVVEDPTPEPNPQP